MAHGGNESPTLDEMIGVVDRQRVRRLPSGELSVYPTPDARSLLQKVGETYILLPDRLTKDNGEDRLQQ